MTNKVLYLNITQAVHIVVCICWNGQAGSIGEGVDKRCHVMLEQVRIRDFSQGENLPHENPKGPHVTFT